MHRCRRPPCRLRLLQQLKNWQRWQRCSSRRQASGEPEDLAEPQPLPMVPQDPAARCVVHPSSGALKALLQMTISTLAVSAVQKSS